MLWDCLKCACRRIAASVTACPMCGKEKEMPTTTTGGSSNGWEENEPGRAQAPVVIPAAQVEEAPTQEQPEPEVEPPVETPAVFVEGEPELEPTGAPAGAPVEPVVTTETVTLPEQPPALTEAPADTAPAETGAA